MHIDARRQAGFVLSLIIPLAVLVIVLLGLPPAAQASNIVVTPCNATKLAAALASAGDGDEISFSCSPGAHTIVVTQTQVLQHDITIDGGDVITLSGGSAVRILSVPAGHTVTLQHLTLRDGLATQGGALRVFGSAIVHFAAFISNQTPSSSSANGGAIYVADTGQLLVTNSRFVSNTVAFQGGAGGAIYSTGIFTAVTTLFSGNNAGYGGAVGQDEGRALIGSSTFFSNTALFGGAVTAGSDLILIADQFDQNVTNGTPTEILAPASISLTLGGGGLNVGVNGQVLVEDSLFKDNAADNGPFGSGGAIVNGGTLTVSDSVLDHNSAQDAGGAIFNKSNLGVYLSDLTSNTALRDGGAISNTGTLVVGGSLLAGNGASQSGGAIANNNQASVTLSELAENTAVSGGGLRNQAGVSFMGASTLVFNDAVGGNGGGILNDAVITVTNSTLANNYSNSNGAAVFSHGSGAVAVLLNSTVVSNTSVAGAAGLKQTSGGVLTLINTIVSDNTPINCAGTSNGGHNLQFGDTSCGSAITLANPHLGGLQDNGGMHVGTSLPALLTTALLPGSAAINNGDTTACPTRDERGYLRVAPCDIGALEFDFPVWLPVALR